MVLYLSESTASDNPVSEDAFMDSLFLKVSFFFFFKTHKGPKAVWQRTPGCRGQKLKSGQRRDRKRESGRESKKPLLPGSSMDLSLSTLLFCHILEGPSRAVRRRRHLTYIK